jgi:hypothetical protein
LSPTSYSMRIIQTIALIAAISGSAFAQSTGFANLNFELAHNDLHDPATGLPYWRVGGTVVPPLVGERIFFSYNSRALDSWAVSLHDGNNQFGLGFIPISGRYSVFLQSGVASTMDFPNGFYGSASISQTATVPANANSILFSARQQFGQMELRMGGQSLPYYKLEDRGSYSIFGSDISAFAGTRSELMFRTPPDSTILLDDIQFSSQVIPEPTTLSLIGAGLSVMILAALRATLHIYSDARQFLNSRSTSSQGQRSR